MGGRSAGSRRSTAQRSSSSSACAACAWPSLQNDGERGSQLPNRPCTCLPPPPSTHATTTTTTPHTRPPKLPTPARLSTVHDVTRRWRPRRSSAPSSRLQGTIESEPKSWRRVRRQSRREPAHGSRLWGWQRGSRQRSRLGCVLGTCSWRRKWPAGATSRGDGGGVGWVGRCRWGTGMGCGRGCGCGRGAMGLRSTARRSSAPSSRRGEWDDGSEQALGQPPRVEPHTPRRPARAWRRQSRQGSRGCRE